MVLGILGRNQRNLSYIKKLNPKKNIRLVDNKYKLKSFLSKRGIPVAKTFAHITDRKQLFYLDFGKLSSRDFVVKPNKGSKGKGIFIVHRTDKFDHTQNATNHNTLRDRLGTWYNDFITRQLPHFDYGYKVKGKNFADIEFKNKILPIIEGNYTFAQKPDTILVEEKLIPGSGFEDFCTWGLADIRVIVCNLVPVAAMLRMPTEQSGGVANLAQGGVGLGIDIAQGTIKTLLLKGKLYSKRFPEPYASLYLQKIPFWDDILLYSSNAQYFLNLGYIGLDWVITNKGPRLLEVNGKAGLEIQNITLTPLQHVLQKIHDLDITSPTKGVDIAKSLFTTSKATAIPSSKVIFLSQKGTMRYTVKDQIQEEDIIAIVKTHSKKSYASASLLAQLGKKKVVDIVLGPDIVIKNVALSPSEHITSDNRIQLGTDALKGLYVKPVHKSHANIKFISPKNIISAEIDDLQILDKKLYDISKRILLSKYLFPTNYLDEFDKFISLKGDYNPEFSYRFPRSKELTLWSSQLQQLRDEHKGNHALQSPFVQLFYAKFDELSDKINLLRAYKKQDHKNIALYNKKLYGNIEQEVLNIAKVRMHDIPVGHMSLSKKKLSAKQVRETIHAICGKYGIYKCRIYNNASSLSRIAVANTYTPTIYLNPRVVRKEHELIGQLEHEIGVHLLRGVNGRTSKWLLLEKGTAHYAIDEEGLATYMSEKAIQEIIPDYHNFRMYIKYLLVDQSERLSFADLVDYLMEHSPYKRSLVGSFKSVLKLKKGIKDTSLAHEGTSFYKGKIYLDGYRKITERLHEGNDIEQLMLGKITIEDLPYIV